ncbi:hypothetical protein CO613_01885 [Lysobacteraceae bacterium NML07-0707]|nr:hypothetical protein CO613_01885 [Xanthomonadaceae bacterium NML07-0707]
MPKSSPPPTNTALPWCSPACVTSVINLNPGSTVSRFNQGAWESNASKRLTSERLKDLFKSSLHEHEIIRATSAANNLSLYTLCWRVRTKARSHGISVAKYCKWKSRYGGMDVAELARMRELEAENSRLKRLYAEQALETHALKDVIAKKYWDR